MNIEEDVIETLNKTIKFYEDLDILYNSKEPCPEIRAIRWIITAYEKEKEKNKKIDEFCRKELAFERRLKREDREPDEFNQGRFYVSENIRKIIKEE